MARLDDARMLDIYEAAVAACAAIESTSREEFLRDRRLQHSVHRELEIIGEAARYLSDDVKALYPKVDWRGWTLLRNVLAHQYFEIDNELIWETVVGEAPALRDCALAFLGRNDSK